MTLRENNGHTRRVVSKKTMLQAAIIMAGTVLSQFGISTRPSNWCAFAITSTDSSISSLLGREYLIPSWFIAIPSHTAIAGNSKGMPPSINMPFFTSSARVLR